MERPLPGQIDGRPAQVFDLEQPRFKGMPIHESHQPGYFYSLHRRHSDAIRNGIKGARTGSSGVIVAMEHSGTHIDALCHQAVDLAFYQGVPAEESIVHGGYAQYGVEQIGPIVARGVLLDVARYRGVKSLVTGDVVDAAELQAVAAAQQVEIEPGDVVLVRTGNDLVWDDPDRYLPGPGMDGSASRWLASLGIKATGADTMAWDAIGLWDAELDMELPGHATFLVEHGIYIIENLYLKALSDAEAWISTFVCTPLKFMGATGSMVSPIAIVAEELGVGI
ncbi:MAG: cyclase family protein [Thermomicrobiales bacterium]|nr:cyclase family protein [Thermomicrobiales bacterium]